MRARMENQENRTTIARLTRWARPAAAVLGIGALAGTIACSGTQAAPQTQPQPQVGATGLSVNCGVGQQAIIRPSMVNGQPISQVDCVPAAAVAAAPAPTPAPVPYAAAPMPLAATPMAAPVPIAYQPYPPARAVVANDVVEYQPRVIKRTRVYARRPTRSVQKSAVIIGSSAGIGAAIGGAIKGGKGALIGAALGGGGAAIWDQATRRH
jgi:hypothetical protein